jgi:outer membrane immunogenic protein
MQESLIVSASETKKDTIMKTKLGAISTIALAVALLTGEGTGGSPASAADLSGRPVSMKDGVDAAPSSASPISWTGFYIGGQVGYANSNHKMSEQAFDGSCTGVPTTAPTPAITSTDFKLHSKADDCIKSGGAWAYAVNPDLSNFADGLNSSGAFGGGTVGFDLQRNRFVVGVFADYNISNATYKQGEVFRGDATSSSIEDGDSWLIAARAGYLFGDEKRALLYVLGGYGQQDVSYHGAVFDVHGADDFKKDVTFSGFVAGAGAEYALTQNVFVGLEWQHFFGGKETVSSNFADGHPCADEITDDMSGDKVMGRIKVKLNGGLFGN